MATETLWETLGSADKEWLAEQIHHLLQAKGGDARYRAWVDALLDDLLWFWTADAVHPDGAVRRDAIKHDPRYLHHTKAARDTLESHWKTKDDKVQHEHAGERSEIIRVLRREAKTKADVVEILNVLNHAVLVTRREHRDLGKREWDTDWRQRRWKVHYDNKKIDVRSPTGKA